MSKKSKTDELEYAAFNGLVKELKSLLDAGVGVETMGGLRMTPLMITAQRSKTKAVKLLIEYGADVNAVNSLGRSVLSYAAEGGNDEVVEMLVARGANINSPTGDPQQAPIWRAVYGKGPKRLKIVQMLLAAGANLDLVNHSGVCLLSWAINGGSPEICQALIDEGTPVDGPDVPGMHGGPILTAIDKGDPDVVKVLIKAGVTLDRPITRPGFEVHPMPMELAMMPPRKPKVIAVLDAALGGASSKTKSAKTPAAKTSKAKPGKPADIPTSWKRIEAWLKANAPDARKSLKAKATDAQIAKAEKEIGIKFPKELVTFFQAHNGQKMDGPCLVPADDISDVGYTLLSLAEGLGERKMWNGLVEAGEFKGVKANAGKGIRAKVWHPGWLPIASNGGGDSLCVDLDPTSAGKVGQVVSLCHETSNRVLVAKSLKQWLTDIAQALEAGEWEPE